MNVCRRALTLSGTRTRGEVAAKALDHAHVYSSLGLPMRAISLACLAGDALRDSFHKKTWTSITKAERFLIIDFALVVYLIPLLSNHVAPGCAPRKWIDDEWYLHRKLVRHYGLPWSKDEFARERRRFLESARDARPVFSTQSYVRRLRRIPVKPINLLAAIALIK